MSRRSHESWPEEGTAEEYVAFVRSAAGNGRVLREYVWLGQEPVALREYELRPGLYYYINDHLGTPQRLITGEGTVVWQAAALPFGRTQVQLGTVQNNLRFPGQYYDAETGLHYNWNRYYDPETGRYLSPDPIGLEGGLNLYAYMENDPVNWSDPWGLSYALPIQWGFRTLAAILAANAAKNTADAVSKNAAKSELCQPEDNNPCSAYPSRSEAFSQASNYAGLSSKWYTVGWDQFNKPRDKSSQISYSKLRQNIGNDPYGYRSSSGGEIVEHPADSHHPCPHFHAKHALSTQGIKFPYDPDKH